MTTGERLRVWREKKDLSQKQAAELAGSSQAAWSRIEAGEVVPELELAIRIQRVARIPVEAWLSRRSATG